MLRTNEVCILFGGPSLKNFDFDKLKNHVVIGCNKSAMEYLCDIIISVDHNFINRNKEWLKDYNGFVALADRSTKSHRFQGMTTCEQINPYFHYRHKRESGLSLDGIHLNGLNTGHAAINFAALQGFEKINLLGLDLNKSGWWHSGYNIQGSIKWMMEWANDINNLKPILDDLDISMTNFNIESAVTAYPFKNIEEFV